MIALSMRNLMNLIESTQGSNLNDAFRRWFGDSKVVGEHGPLAVHHGSNAHAYSAGQIDVFDTRPMSGRGAAFFSPSPHLAREYGERVYSVYLRIENPLVVFGDGKGWTSLGGATKVGGRVTDQLRAHHRKQAADLDNIFRELSDLGLDDLSGDAPPSKSKIADDADDLGQFSLGILPGMNDFGSTDAIVQQARRMGYDGVIFKDIIDSPTSDRNLYKNAPTDVYAVFSPYQIKSVENIGTWDGGDPDIMK